MYIFCEKNCYFVRPILLSETNEKIDKVGKNVEILKDTVQRNEDACQRTSEMQTCKYI